MSLFFLFEQCEMWPANELRKESLDLSHATVHSGGLFAYFLNLVDENAPSLDLVLSSSGHSLGLSIIMITVVVLVAVPYNCIMCC